MMELYANEISFTDDCIAEVESIRKTGKLYRELREYGITTCRISNEQLSRMIEVLSLNEKKKELIDFVYAFFRAPYEESDIVEAESEMYLSHNKWMCEGELCFGLAMAYITNTASISLDDTRWPDTVYILMDEVQVSVRNFASPVHVNAHEKWLKTLLPIVLLPTYVSPHEKKIDLRDDHGKDKLMAFAKRLVKSQYVVGIVNSLPYNRGVRKFIKAIKEDGIIECVLYWYDEGFGMAVKTTGRDRRETEEIATILEREYAKNRR